MKPNHRECGDCSLCCKLLAIPELNCGEGDWCALCNPPKGCGSYENRPPSCHDFECLWLQGRMPENLKPNRIGAVAHSSDGGATIKIHLDAGQTADAMDKGLRAFINAMDAEGRNVRVSSLENHPA